MRTLKPLLTYILRAGGVHRDLEKLSIALESHPDRFAVNVVTDALDELQIVNAAMIIEPAQLEEVPLPILAVANISGQSQYVYIKKIENQVITVVDELLQVVQYDVSSFRQMMDGVIIAIEKENHKHLQIKQAFQKIWPLLLFTFSAIAGLLWMKYQSDSPISYLVYGLCCLLGTGLSLLIIEFERGGIMLNKNFCEDGRNISCSTVLSSAGSELVRGLKLIDIAIIYFVGQLMVMTLLLPFGINDLSRMILLNSSMGLLIIPYSIYYQVIKIKKWCILCLLMIGIMIVQFFVAYWGVEDSGKLSVNYSLLPLVMVSYALITALWFTYKRQWEKADKSKHNELIAYSFKRNYHFFNAYYRQLPNLDFSGWQTNCYSGKKDAPLQLVVVKNLYCEPCEKTFIALKKLESDSPDLNICISYTFHFKDETDNRFLAAERIMHAAATHPGQLNQILTDWYTLKDEEKFTTLYPYQHNTSDLIQGMLISQLLFRQRNGISLTPGLILNGKLLPEIYTIGDIKWLLSYFLINEDQRSVLQQQQPAMVMASPL